MKNEKPVQQLLWNYSSWFWNSCQEKHEVTLDVYMSQKLPQNHYEITVYDFQTCPEKTGYSRI